MKPPGRALSPALAALTFAVVALGATAPATLPHAESVPPRTPGVVSFLAVGDQGTGGTGQRHVAASMSKVIGASPVDFVLLLGDLFYPNGLFSAADPLFDRLFKDVYTEKTFSMPFFPVLGNHEYHRNAGAVPRLGARDARWRMPARRYAFVEPLAEGKNAVFVALDTTAFDSPARVTPARDVRPPLEGVAEELAGTPATVWRFVFGHHPPATSGAHGSSEGILKTLCPVLAAARVDLYITGHDHILESLAAVAGVPVVVSGGGGGWDRATPIVRVRPESQFRHTGGGFVRADVTVEKAEFTFYDVDGRSLYVRTLHPNPPAPGTTPLPAKP